MEMLFAIFIFISVFLTLYSYDYLVKQKTYDVILLRLQICSVLLVGMSMLFLMIK